VLRIGITITNTESQQVSFVLLSGLLLSRARRAVEDHHGYIGVPWISWHTFRWTHSTLLQLAGGSAKDVQAQLGNAQITSTLGIYTIPVPGRETFAIGDEWWRVSSSRGNPKSPAPRYFQ
jgi:integrase